MYVDGLGERNTIDTGGFPVVWLGDGIGQDPSQGGTNRYGPGDILVDADTGDVYQIGGDWHLRPLGSSTSSAPPPAEPAPSLVEHFFYVDSGAVIEKWSYSDGTAQFANTGQWSDYGDGAASGNMWDLVGSHQQQTQPAPGGSAPGSGGFDQPNNVGGYGPYATPDPPQLRDVNQYVQGSELWLDQVDQYGNHYYSYLGPAPAQPQPTAPAAVATPAPTVQRPPGIAAPTVQRPTVQAPNIYQQQPATPTPAAVTTPRQQAPTSPATVYSTVNGPKTLAQIQAELRQAGWPGPAAGEDPTGSAIAAYQRATGGAVVTSPTSATRPSGSTPAVSVTGNPSAFLQDFAKMLGRADWIGGVPNVLVLAGGYAGYRMFSGRRRR